jgi:hypothetical protein
MIFDIWLGCTFIIILCIAAAVAPLIFDKNVGGGCINFRTEVVFAVFFENGLHAKKRFFGCFVGYFVGCFIGYFGVFGFVAVLY